VIDVGGVVLPDLRRDLQIDPEARGGHLRNELLAV
jgi:hypothetical protein